MKLEKSQWNGCPIRYSAEILADKWTFLILRDLMFRGKKGYNAFLQSSENISTNILADRLLKLENNGLINKIKDIRNKKQYIYSLTQKGVDLIPTMFCFFEWAFKYDENTFLSQEIMDSMKSDSRSLAEQYADGQIVQLGSLEP
jgi:DNA-binding HxlR family transcriptional regulator